MNYSNWKNKINELNIQDDVLENVLELFSKYSHNKSFSFIPITDEKLVSSFNNINNYKPLSICLDIEFQSSIVKGNKYIHTDHVHKEKAAKFIRELGMLFFLKDKSYNLYYIGSIFLNFKELSEFRGFHPKNIRLVSARYATVTDNTYDKMNSLEEMFHVENIVELLDPTRDNKGQFKNDKNYQSLIRKISTQVYQNYLFERILPDKAQENIKEAFGHLFKATNLDGALSEIRYIKRQLNKIQFDVYAKFLDKTTLQNFRKINKYYWEDPLVKGRVRLMHNKYKDFMELFEDLSLDAVLVVKGKMDIIALKNMATLIIPYADFFLDNSYDIETFNGFSKTHYKGSQLEQTYKGLIKTKIYQGAPKKLFDEIMKPIGEQAHNPVVDSLFSIIVAIVINLGLNKYFSSDNIMKGGSASNTCNLALPSYRMHDSMHFKQYLKCKGRYLELKSNIPT
jgi:hypothetical protein